MYVRKTGMSYTLLMMISKIYIVFMLLARSSTCYVRDWAGCIVSSFLIIFGITCITVISVYKEKVKDEVHL